MTQVQALSALMVLFSGTLVTQGAPILQYRFGNDTKDLSATLDASIAPHVTAGAFGDLAGLLGWNQLSSPSFSGGAVYTHGTTGDIATTNAFTFDLSIDHGWDLSLDGWSTSFWVPSTDTQFHMRIDELAGNDSVVSTYAWGWFTASTAEPFHTDDIPFGEAPGEILLAGGGTYRFAVSLVNGAGDKYAYIDNFTLDGAIEKSSHAPEPAAALLLTAGLAPITFRGCRG